MWDYKQIVVNKKKVLEHRYIMERHLGRPLSKDEQIHHINGNGKDNRIENLKLCSNNSEHMKIHGQEIREKKGKKLKCPTCENEFIIKMAQYKYKSKTQNNFYCSRECMKIGFKKGRGKNNNYLEIIKKYNKKGWSGYKIAKEFNLNRKTVYNYLKELNYVNKRPKKIKGKLCYCPRCKTYLPFNKFHKHRRNKCGLRTYCKKCRTQ